jgi:hypothetical protein
MIDFVIILLEKEKNLYRLVYFLCQKIGFNLGLYHY